MAGTGLRREEEPAAKRRATKPNATRKTQTKAEQYRFLKEEAENLGFSNDQSKFRSEEPGNVPVAHREIFEHIQILGRKEYHAYDVDPNPEHIYKPWKLFNKSKASALRQLAVECVQEKRNEAGWRATIEYRLFSRFEDEVAW